MSLLFFICLNWKKRVREALLLLLMTYTTIVIPKNLPSLKRHIARYRSPLILWWTPFGISDEVFESFRMSNSRCQCRFTENRNLFNADEVEAIIFYGSHIEADRAYLPPRLEKHLWAVLHEESPRNNALFLYEPFLALFHVSSTFSRFSDMPLTTLYLNSTEDLTSAEFYIPTKEKNSLLEDLAPVLYIQSDCSTPNDRDSYVAELMKYIKVDSYGACLNNKPIPEEFKDSMSTFRSKEFHHFVSRYKFTIAIENSICYDYITEKLWRPLVVGSVPIYAGSPTVKDFLPNEKSAILVSDFESPKHLAEYLHKLNNNDELYEEYLEHKLYYKIQNQNLIEAVKSRKYEIEPKSPNFIEAFSCHVCNLILNDKGFNRTARVNKNHYDCPLPVSLLTNTKNNTNWWSDHWESGASLGRIVVEKA